MCTVLQCMPQVGGLLRAAFQSLKTTYPLCSGKILFSAVFIPEKCTVDVQQQFQQ